MMHESRTTLSSYLTRLQSQGQVVFSGQEAQKALGVSRSAFLDAAEKQQRRKHLISPRRDFYVIVSPRYPSWGAPPPTPIRIGKLPPGTSFRPLLRRM